MPSAADVVKRLGQELVVAAVGAVDGVRGRQRQHRTDGAALLPDARVRRAVDQPVAGQRRGRTPRTNGSGSAG